MSEGLRRWKPQPSTVIAVVALFVALAGSAYAAQKIGKNKVKSKHIKDGQVFSVDVADLGIATVDLADNSVNSAKVAADSLAANDLANNSVGTGELADNSVNSAKVAADSLAAIDLANNSVGTGELADNAVTNAKVADNAIGSAEVAADSLGAGDLATGSVQSPEMNDLHVHPSAATTVVGGVDNNGVFNSATATASCGIGEHLYAWSVRWPTVAGGGEEVQVSQTTPDFTLDEVTVTAGTDEGANEDFVVDAWCTVAT